MSEAKKKPVKQTSKIILAIKKLMKAKKKTTPTFVRRIGVRSVKKKSKKKWDTWRKPRGIDIKWKKGDGAKVTEGYKSPKEVRGIHPSG